MKHLEVEVLHLAPGLGDASGGPSRSIPQLCQSLANQGLRLGLAYPVGINDEHFSIDACREAGVQVFPLNGSSWQVQVAELIGRGELVHLHGVWMRFCHASAKLARKHRRPLIISPRGMLEPWALQYHAFRKKIAWAVYQHHDLQSASALHATSVNERENLKRLGLPSNRRGSERRRGSTTV